MKQYQIKTEKTKEKQKKNKRKKNKLIFFSLFILLPVFLRPRNQ